jgi:hypothetical protein
VTTLSAVETAAVATAAVATAAPLVRGWREQYWYCQLQLLLVVRLQVMRLVPPLHEAMAIAD